MDLVTLLMACAVSIGTHGASSCSTQSPTSRHVIASADGRSGSAQTLQLRPRSPTRRSTAGSSFIDEASNRFSIPEVWIRAVMAAESGGQTVLDGRPITSSAGAMGLMQVMPETYAEMRLRYGLGADPYDPHDNILAGVAYLRAMYDRYGYPGIFAAYNAGPARFDDNCCAAFPSRTRRCITSNRSVPDLHDAVSAERPDAAARLRAGVPRMGSPPPTTLCFFRSGSRPSQWCGPPSPSPATLFPLDSARAGPMSDGLFVPLAGASHAGEGAAMTAYFRRPMTASPRQIRPLRCPKRWPFPTLPFAANRHVERSRTGDADIRMSLARQMDRQIRRAR